MIQADFFVLTALNVETEALKKHLRDVAWIQGTPYAYGIVTSRDAGYKYTVVFAQCDDSGINPAGALTKEAIKEYNPRYVLLVGIAAGFPENGVLLGDVLVPEWIAPYEKAKLKPGVVERRGRPLPVTASALLSLARRIAEHERHSWHRAICEVRPSNEGRDFPVVYAKSQSVLGSGAKIVADLLAQERRWLLDTYHENALGLEVEAAETALACRECETNFLVIKAVQDDATENKDAVESKDLWRAYAADAAATFAVTLMEFAPLARVRPALITSISRLSTDIDQLTSLHSYLTWVRNKCQELKLQAIGEQAIRHQEKIKLGNVYISLDTRERIATCEDSSGRVHRILPSDIETSGIEAMGNWHLLPMTVEESLDFHKDIILLGNPGGGKTTVLKHLALFLASGATMDQLAWSQTSEKLRWTHGPLVPIVISLKDFCDSKNFGSTAGSLWDFVEDQLRPVNQAVGPMKSILAEGGAVVLLDDLEKVPYEKRSTIVNAMSDFRHLYESCRYVVACREIDYHSMEVSLSSPFHIVTIAPLTLDKVDDFVEVWYREFRNLGWRVLEGADEELKGAIRQHDLVSLAQYPRLLAELTIIHSIHHRIPKDRVDLFSEVINLLLRTYSDTSLRVEPSVAGPSLLNLSRKEIELALYEMAFLCLIDKAPDATGVEKTRVLKRMERHFEGDADKAKLFCELAESEVGIVECAGNQMFDFRHPSLQEYLAAKCLASRSDFISSGVDIVRTNFSKWHSVFAMAVRLAGADIGVSAVHSLCPYDPPPHVPADFVEKEQWYTVWMGAEALCELGPHELRQRPERLQVLNFVVKWLVALIQSNALSPNERDEVGGLLSVLGDTRHGVSSLELDLVRVGKGIVVLGFGEGDGKRFEYDVPYEYYVSRYLVTNAQYMLFLAERPEYPLPYDEEQIWDSGTRCVKSKFLNHPVTGVSWNDAKAFCKWLTEKLNWTDSLSTDYVARLPTDPEWTKMYRGGKYLPEGSPNRNAASVYPWGDEWKEGYANVPESKNSVPHTTTVGIYPLGATPYGILDGCGNVLEWINTSWGSFDPEIPGFPQIYDPGDGRESENVEGFRILRGGSWLFSEGGAKCACRLDPSSRFPDTGFRVFIGPADPLPVLHSASSETVNNQKMKKGGISTC